MLELWHSIAAFFDAWAWWIAMASVAMFILSIAAIPWIVARIPENYFAHQHRHKLKASPHHPIIGMLLLMVKNILGMILLLMGIIMLFTPGQGLLSMLFGLLLMNYPGKYRLECWLVQKPLIFDTINTMRAKRGQPALLPPPHSTSTKKP